MSGGDPPLPPSRPPYHSWHSRPSHRRRGGPLGNTRNGWVGRRPRSPPLPPPRPRHLRPSYKHHRHVPQSSPSSSQTQHHATGYHPHGPPPPLSRNLQGRLRSPPRSPLRHSDLGGHRLESQPYRGEPGPSHRVEPPEHMSYRGSDPPSFRAPPLKSRGESFSFSSERASLRGPAEHPPYRGEPGPLYRADSVLPRDDFEPRRGLGGLGGTGGGEGLSSRAESSSQYGAWYRQPSKIHKTLKPKKRRPPPHMVGALRASAPYLSKPQSPILSRIGLPTGDRGSISSRVGMGPGSGSVRRGPGPNVNSPKLSQELSSNSNRSNTHDSYVFGAPKLRRSGSSPRQQHSMRLNLSPDERTNNDRQKWQSNGPVHGYSGKQESLLPNGTDGHSKPSFERKGTEDKSLKAEPVTDDATICNGVGTSRTIKFPSVLSKRASSSDPERCSPIRSGRTGSPVGIKVAREELNGEATDPALKNDVTGTASEVKLPSKPEDNVEIEAKKADHQSSGPVEVKVKPESPTFTKPASTHADAQTTARSAGSIDGGEQWTSQEQHSSPMRDKKTRQSAPTGPFLPRTSPEGLSSENIASPLKSAEDFRSTPQSQSETQNDSKLQNKLSAILPSLAIPESPIPVPAPAMSLLRSTPRSRTKSSSFEGKLGSLSSFGNLSPSPLPTTTEFLRTSATKTGMASGDLVRQIHEVEGKITATERALADMRSDFPGRASANGSFSQLRKEESEMEVEWSNEYAAVAKEIVAKAEKDTVVRLTKRSRHPLHSAARLLLVRNQAVAAASHAELRTFCSDVELGLDGVVENGKFVPELSREMRTKVTEYLRRKRAADSERRRRLAKEYTSLMHLWRRKLDSAHEKRSKEKRDAMRERDRFILLCTKGTSALLTSRTSSGRTSTKIVPSVAANGQTNGTAELDQMLTEIETEGGTPGSRSIWSKTLADIPTQNASRYPLDCFSVMMADPLAEHYASRAINPWRFEEVVVFLEKYLTCSKNFIKIASFLEHKSPRDCSYFYYMNKLHLGLKQFTKEASAMKRRGTLQRHIIQTAKQFAFLNPEEQSADSFYVSVQNAVSVGAAERFMANDAKGGNFHSLGRPGYGLERRDFRNVPLKRSEKILNDVNVIDLTGIERKHFAQAMAVHGTDWKAVASYLSVPGKSSTHYREFFRRNKRKLETEDIREHSRARLLLPSRSPNLGSKCSPRVSPRSSPRHSGNGNRSKISDSLEADSPDVMQLDSTDIEDSATRDTIPGNKDTRPQRAKEDGLRSRQEAVASLRGTKKTEKEAKKGKPTATWTADECKQFRVLFKQHGRDWKAIAQLMPPKTPTQIKGYWRTVAREVGDGLTTDSARSTKSDKKRLKRRTSSEMLFRQSTSATLNDLRASPKPKSPRDKKEEAMNYQDGHDSSKREAENALGEEVIGEAKDLLGGVLKANQNPKQSEGQEDGTPTEIATSEERPDVSRMRWPMLRSIPPPHLRSVQVWRGKMTSQTARDSSKIATAQFLRETAAPVVQKGVQNANHELGPRRVAESYGVSRRLGSRLHDPADGEAKPGSE